MKTVSVDRYEPPPPFLRLSCHGEAYEWLLHYAEDLRLPAGLNDGGLKISCRPSYVIAYYHSGEGEIRLGDQVQTVVARSLVLSEPRVHRQLIPRTATPLRATILTFDFRTRSGEYLTCPWHELLSLVAGESLPPLAPELQLTEEQHLTMVERLDRVMRCYHPVAELPWFPLNRAFFELLLFLIEAVALPGSAYPPSIPGLRKVQREIERHFTESLPLAYLAGVAELSPTYLCSCFKSAFGQTPREYQLRLQLHLAQRLLATQTNSISEIAEACGFSSRHYFSRMFRNRLGINPQAYRSQHT